MTRHLGSDRTNWRRNAASACRRAAVACLFAATGAMAAGFPRVGLTIGMLMIALVLAFVVLERI